MYTPRETSFAAPALKNFTGDERYINRVRGSIGSLSYRRTLFFVIKYSASPERHTIFFIYNEKIKKKQREKRNAQLSCSCISTRILRAFACSHSRTFPHFSHTVCVFLHTLRIYRYAVFALGGGGRDGEGAGWSRSRSRYSSFRLYAHRSLRPVSLRRNRGARSPRPRA